MWSFAECWMIILTLTDIRLSMKHPMGPMGWMQCAGAATDSSSSMSCSPDWTALPCYAGMAMVGHRSPFADRSVRRCRSHPRFWSARRRLPAQALSIPWNSLAHSRDPTPRQQACSCPGETSVLVRNGLKSTWWFSDFGSRTACCSDSRARPDWGRVRVISRISLKRRDRYFRERIWLSGSSSPRYQPRGPPP